MNELLNWIKNLTGASVVMSYTVRKIQPLQKCSHFGFHYRGDKDPSPFSSEKKSENEVMRRVRRVLDVVYGVPVVPDAYTIMDPPKEVCETFYSSHG